MDKTQGNGYGLIENWKRRSLVIRTLNLVKYLPLDESLKLFFNGGWEKNKEEEERGWWRPGENEGEEKWGAFIHPLNL